MSKHTDERELALCAGLILQRFACLFFVLVLVGVFLVGSVLFSSAKAMT